MKPKICISKFIPFKGYIAITLFMWIIIRKENLSLFNDRSYNHEMIHFKQQCEMLVLLFFIWYIIEYLCKSIYYSSFKLGYLNLSFEREAYENQNNLSYYSKRKMFSWVKYIIK